MQGKELLLGVLNHKEYGMVPWVPFAGVHAGRLKGFSADEILQDEFKLLDSLKEVNSQYQPDGQPVLFDLQVEAEILGCELKWAKKAPPSVVSHPLSENPDVPSRLPEKSDGRLPMILNVMQEFKKYAGTSTALFGLVCGPFTLASHLRGTDIFMDMIDNPEYVQNLIAYTKDVTIRMAEFYIEAGMDVIAVVDPITSQISPFHFKEFLSKRFTEIFDFIKEHKTASSFFVCGDATKNIEEMCRTRPDSIFIDENINIAEAKKITDRNTIVIGGNIPLTSVMLLGTQKDNMKFVIDMLDTLDHKNLVIAPGCDMPYDVPPENVIGVVQAIRNPEEIKHVLQHYKEEEITIEVDLPDYKNLRKPLIEVFTVDSATCPACGYMANAAHEAKNHFGDKVDYVERKIIIMENLKRVSKLGIKNLPCILINGELKYSSIIPGKKDLLATIESYL